VLLPPPRRRWVEVWAGRQALASNGEFIDDLLERVGAPVTSSRTWWTTWLRARQDVSPWIAVLRDDERLHALAPLALRRRGHRTEVVGLGDGVTDDLRLPASGEPDGAQLATFLAGHLGRMRGPWTLALRQLRVDDPMASALAGLLPHASLIRGRAAPRTRIADREITGYFSRNHRKSARNRHNRLARDGHEPVVSFWRDPTEIARRLDDVVEVCRLRERQMLGHSALDDPGREQFFREVVVALAGEGRAELAELRCRDALVAYSVGFVDGRVYRTWNGHHDPAWAAYGPGQVLDYLLVERVLRDGEIDLIDWMMGMHAYKVRMATHAEPSIDLLAWSGPVVGATAFGPPRLRSRLEDAADHDEQAERALRLLRHTRDRVRRWSA
jgi:CelD/BcsL family acetyltransferase involved in cellulose biosynthesis